MLSSIMEINSPVCNIPNVGLLEKSKRCSINMVRQFLNLETALGNCSLLDNNRQKIRMEVVC
jgi:hypothetical protein